MFLIFSSIAIIPASLLSLQTVALGTVQRLFCRFNIPKVWGVRCSSGWWFLWDGNSDSIFKWLHLHCFLHLPCKISDSSVRPHGEGENVRLHEGELIIQLELRFQIQSSPIKSKARCNYRYFIWKGAPGFSQKNIDIEGREGIKEEKESIKCTLPSWLPQRATETQFLWEVWEVGQNTSKLPTLSAEMAHIFTKSPSTTGGRLLPETLSLWHFFLTLPKGQVCPQARTTPLGKESRYSK